MANYPRVTHPCAAKHTRYCYRMYSARLACLIHAASVRSEPESNSPSINDYQSPTLNQNQITDSNLVAYYLTLEIRSPCRSPHAHARGYQPGNVFKGLILLIAQVNFQRTT